MPSWGAEPDGEQWYGFPLLREGYVKVARDRLGPAVDADVDRAGTSEFAADVEAMLRRRIPALAGSPGAHGRSCLYTMTPDAHFHHRPGAGDPSGWWWPAPAAATPSSSAGSSGRWSPAWSRTARTRRATRYASATGSAAT